VVDDVRFDDGEDGRALFRGVEDKDQDAHVWNGGGGRGWKINTQVYMKGSGSNWSADRRSFPKKKKTTEKNQLKVRLTTRVVQVCFADVEERVGQEQFPNQQHDQVGVVRAQVLEAPSNGPSIL
jgi:hypothetical protein